MTLQLNKKYLKPDLTVKGIPQIRGSVSMIDSLFFAGVSFYKSQNLHLHIAKAKEGGGSIRLIFKSSRLFKEMKLFWSFCNGSLKMVKK